MHPSLLPDQHSRRMLQLTQRLLLVFILIVIYLTMFPFSFDLSPEALQRAWREAEKYPFLRANGRYRASGADMISNFGMFLPFGFLVQGLLMFRDNKWGKRIFAATFLSLAFSLSIEVLQFLQKARVASVNDLLSNTLGGLTGAIIARRYVFKAGLLLDRLISYLKLHPLYLISLMIAAAQSVLILFPFNFNFKVNRYKHSVFDYLETWHNLPIYHGFAPSQHELQTLFIGFLLAGISLYAVRWHHPGIRSFSRLIVLANLLFYPLLTLVQLFSQGKQVTAGTLVCGLTGSVAGSILFYFMLRHAWHRAGKKIPLSFRLVSRLLWGTYGLLLLIWLFYPLAFYWPAEQLVSLNGYAFLPYGTIHPDETTDFIREQIGLLVLIFPLGFLLAERHAQNPVIVRIFRVVLLGVLAGFTIEVLQFFSTMHIADSSEALHFTLALALGGVYQNWWWHNVHHREIENSRSRIFRLLDREPVS